MSSASSCYKSAFSELDLALLLASDPQKVLSEGKHGLTEWGRDGISKTSSS